MLMTMNQPIWCLPLRSTFKQQSLNNLHHVSFNYVDVMARVSPKEIVGKSYFLQKLMFHPHFRKIACCLFNKAAAATPL